MNLLPHLSMKGMRCGRQPAPQPFASPCSLPDRRYHPETSAGMRPSLRPWHKPEALQARCRFHATRAQGKSQPNTLEPQPHMVNVSFKVQYKCSFGQSIALIGDVAPLGNWVSSRGRDMQWSCGDNWRCDVVVPAGSSLECKYVIIDDAGQALRWQEGSNMVVQVPYSIHGLPVEKYDVSISWCKSSMSLTAHPLIAPTAAATAAAGASVTATSSSVASAASVAPVAAPVVPLTAWARAKGSSLPDQANSASSRSELNSQAAVLAHQAKQLAHCAAASEAAVQATQQTPLSQDPSQFQQQRQCQLSVSVVAPQQSQAAQQQRQQLQQHNQATTSGSLVATLMHAATAVMDPSPAAPSSPASSSALRSASFVGQAHATGAAPGPSVASAATPAVPAPSSPSFQLTPASDDEPMSIVLPSRRGSSPPIKISLSSSFSKLMEIPSTAPRSACSMAPASAHGTAGSSSSSASAGGADASTAKVTAASIQSHPIDLGSPAAAATNPVPAVDAAVTSASSGPITSTPHNAPSSGPSSSKSHRGASARRALSSSSSSLTPVWGMEYDIYATAYGIPYMHTPFDLEAYAAYDQTSTEPVSAAAPRLSVTAGLGGLVSKAMAAGADLLESAVQAARGTKSASPSPALSSTSSTAEARLLSSDFLPTTADSTAPALAAAAPAPTAPVAPPAASVPIFSMSSATAVATAATAPSAAPAMAPAAGASTASSPSSSAPMDMYRQVSRSSSSVSDWAARTLMEMSSGQTMLDEDSDDDEETADDEALMAQALASPTAPADMTALLQQLGTALGRSVRLRYEGIEPASSDLLELDRKIALASSKLYRQRDALLTGWVRKETRRQLATAATAGGRQPLNSLTPM